ncbi:MAG: hypothetical protein WB611_06360 [Stellaceae bacterium]
MNNTATVAPRGLATDETDRLISSDKVKGTPVYNPKGERLGKVIIMTQCALASTRSASLKTRNARPAAIVRM